jgi:hypothetical protein
MFASGKFFLYIGWKKISQSWFISIPFRRMRPKAGILHLSEALIAGFLT